jgi:hypothetical protein
MAIELVQATELLRTIVSNCVTVHRNDDTFFGRGLRRTQGLAILFGRIQSVLVMTTESGVAVTMSQQDLVGEGRIEDVVADNIVLLAPRSVVL